MPFLYSFLTADTLKGFMLFVVSHPTFFDLDAVSAEPRAIDNITSLTLTTGERKVRKYMNQTWSNKIE